VHCKIGYSRSAAVVGAYLLGIGRVQNSDDAIGLLRRARPSIVVRPEVYEALIQFAEKGAIMAR
jgi:protein-tyrosine phosphatase